MANLQEVKVPDIGGAKNVDVIELLVAPGDTVAVDSSLLTLESDKASMEIPSPYAGVVRDLKVKVGDKVSEGSVILTIEMAEGAGAKTAEAPAQVDDKQQPSSKTTETVAEQKSASESE